MNKINVLDNKTINKIAAGEVVERPASIVKELIENSIDAKATAVTVEIKNGGISLIRITDNGTGIPKGEIKTAFIRHATSKIKDETDLSNILSLGFRGEALASIAAVSQVEVITKEYSEITGMRIQINGGVVEEETEVGCPEGTTMIIKNIFFNTPARRKFLKTEQTEASYIDEIVTKIALGHPEIAFKFINNGKVIFSTSGNNDLQKVIFNVYGRDISKKLIEIKYNDNNINIEGYIAKPEINRATRMYENFFVNGRYIKSNFLESILEESYKSYMMQKRFPFCVLKLSILPEDVDSNVHPAKTEVRFKEEGLVREAVSKVIINTLHNQTFIVDIKLDKPNEEKIIYDKSMLREAFEVENRKLVDQEIRESGSQDVREKFSPISEGAVTLVTGGVDPIPKYTQPNFTDDTNYAITEMVKESENKEYMREKEMFKNYKIIGQVFNTYWILEQAGIMYIIDQHAAHEKVLFEKLMKEFENGTTMSQQLLQPLVVEVSMKEKEVIENNIDIIKKLGFDIEEFGQGSYAIREVPFIFDKPGDSKFFLDIIDEMLETKIKNMYNSKYDEIATMSCKAAVKANDKMDFEESRRMIEDLMKLDNPFNCPHGRPIIISMDKYEIEKKFKRIV